MDFSLHYVASSGFVLLGPEGGAAVTLLAMAWLAAWLTWGAARGEKQKDAGDA